MDYLVYHDESKQGGFWHGMLLVPVHKKSILVKHLQDVRDCVGWKDYVELKHISKLIAKKAQCAKAWIQIGVNSLIQQKFAPIIVHIGKDWVAGKLVDSQIVLKEKIGAKFILFADKDSALSGFDPAMEYAKKFEISYSMGLKGGLHFLGNDLESINLVGLHFDGHQHLGRNVDLDLIRKRLAGLRGYCGIDENVIIDDRSSNHGNANPQGYDDCQLLQLTDLLVGGFRTYLHGSTKSFHEELCYPIKKNLIDKHNCGYARMRNSRWFNGFCMSQYQLVDDQFNFSNIEIAQEDSRQLSLF